MELIRKVGQTKFKKDGLKGLVTLHDSGELAASCDHKYALGVEPSSGYAIVNKNDIKARKSALDMLFDNGTPFICGIKKANRKDDQIQFSIDGVNGYLTIYDDKKIGITKEYKYLFDDIKKENLSSTENNETCYILKPKKKTVSLIIDRFFNHEEGTDSTRKSTSIDTFFKSKASTDLNLPSCKELNLIAKSIRKDTGSEQPNPEHIFEVWQKLNNQELNDDARKHLRQECFRKKQN